MRRRFLVNMDDSEMGWRFSTEDRRGSKASLKFSHSIEEVERVMSRLPPREADMVRMYYMLGKEQKEIGRIFHVSQGDVFYRLNRAVKRIKFLMELPDISRETMDKELGPILQDESHLDIMWGLYSTTSQTEVAKYVHMTQGKIRYRFLKCLKRIEECAEVEPDKYQIYVVAFNMIRNNFNALRELSTQARWAHKFEGEKRQAKE